MHAQRFTHHVCIIEFVLVHWNSTMPESAHACRPSRQRKSVIHGAISAPAGHFVSYIRQFQASEGILALVFITFQLASVVSIEIQSIFMPRAQIQVCKMSSGQQRTCESRLYQKLAFRVGEKQCFRLSFSIMSS